MVPKIIVDLSVSFVFIITLVLGYQVKRMADLIPSKYEEKRAERIDRYSEAIKGLFTRGGEEFVQSSAFINDKRLFVEVANTPEKRAKGLMDRDYMDDNAGMFFVYGKEILPTFWMKNTNIPLDMIWIDKFYRIIGVEKNVPPCTTLNCLRYSPAQNIQYVLEVNGGWFDENNVSVGDVVKMVY